MNFKGTIIVVDPIIVNSNWTREEILRKKESRDFDYFWIDLRKTNWVNIMSFDDILTSLDAENRIVKISNALKAFKGDPINNQADFLARLNGVKYEKRIRTESGNLIVMNLSDALKINPNIMSDFGDWCFSVLDLPVCNVEYVSTFDHGEEESTEHLLITGTKTIFTL